VARITSADAVLRLVILVKAHNPLRSQAKESPTQHQIGPTSNPLLATSFHLIRENSDDRDNIRSETAVFDHRNPFPLVVEPGKAYATSRSPQRACLQPSFAARFFPDLPCQAANKNHQARCMEGTIKAFVFAFCSGSSCWNLGSFFFSCSP